MKHRFDNLGSFVAALEREGELIRVKAPVSPLLEITEITDRMSKSPGGGKALLFERPAGSSLPVLINAFGSEKRICLALGVSDLEELAGRIRAILHQAPPETLRQKLSLAAQAMGWARFPPRRARKGRVPCQEVVYRGDEVDLGLLPVLQCWPKDGGRFITLPVVFTKSLVTGRRNAGMYRMQVYDRNTTGMHWHIHKDGSHYFQEYLRAGKRMDVAVAIGTDPAITYAATAPLPRGVDEMVLAGFIRGAPVSMVRCLTSDLMVPAEAEIVLEGYVDPDERRTEGPFGDHTGYYSPADEYPVFHVTAMTHRRGAIYSTTVVGRPPMEDCYLAEATERLFLPLLQTLFPEVRDYWMPWEGVFHNLTVVALEKEYPGHAKKVMQGLWGSGQMSFCKAMVMVDHDAPLHRGGDLLHHLLDRVDLKRDIMITEGILDVLDHSSPQENYGSKVGIDATTPVRGEPARHRSEAARERHLRPETVLADLKALDPAFTGCRIFFETSGHPIVALTLDRDRVPASRRAVEVLAAADSPFPGAILTLFDDGTSLEDAPGLLWKACNNIDPARDMVPRGEGMILNACTKKAEEGHPRPWPEEIVMSPGVQERVTARLAELGPGYLAALLGGDG